MTDSPEKFSFESDEHARARRDQARALRTAAERDGLRFEAYLPPALATWVLDMVERGEFLDPSEATFVFLGQAHDLDPHDDLKREILQRRLDDALADPRPAIGMEELRAHLEEQRANRGEPAYWPSIDLSEG